MPIRPIDIVKSHEASQFRYLQNQKLQHEQVQISKDFQNLIQAESSRPVETAKSENKDFRYDAKEESRNKYNGPKGNKKQKKDKERKKGTEYKGGRPGGIDILV